MNSVLLFMVWGHDDIPPAHLFSVVASHFVIGVEDLGFRAWGLGFRVWELRMNSVLMHTRNGILCVVAISTARHAGQQCDVPLPREIPWRGASLKPQH